MSKHSKLGILMVSVSLSAMAGCSQPNTTNPNPQPTPTATASPSTNPSSQPSGNPSSNPSSQPSGNPSSNPSSQPSSDPSTQPSGSPSSSPTAKPDDTSVFEKTTFNGKVFDDSNAPLDGVTIKAHSLNSGVPFEATAVTAGGSYAFNNVPAGVTIEITAGRNGYTSRRRVEVLKSNKNGDPNANRYDFGSDGSTTAFGSAFSALSDKPEVTNVTPGRNASGISPTTSFVLKFSEPMDRATVQDAFEVRANNNKKLTVDTSGNDTVTGSSSSPPAATGTRIWDKAAFNISWNTDDTEATFTFKEERALPTDKDSDKVPDYAVDLAKGDIKDKAGVSRNETPGKFKLTEGNFEPAYKFAINTDVQKPTVDSITAQTLENSGTNGDAIKVRYNKRMIHYTLGPSIAGGMGGQANQAAGANNTVSSAQAADNYKVTVIRGGTTILNATAWSALGGSAVFDTNDPTHHTVLLIPPAAANIYQPGDNVIIKVDTTVLDPAGNAVESSSNSNSASANAS